MSALLTDREATERISAILEPYTIRQLANAAGRSLEAAKYWKSGEKCPNAASLINMARTLPAVAVWLRAEIGSPTRGE